MRFHTPVIYTPEELDQLHNPYKQKARRLLYNAIRRGEIVRPDHCSECNETDGIQGHHDDYDQPLVVIWLCRRCHAKRHPHKPGRITNRYQK